MIALETIINRWVISKNVSIEVSFSSNKLDNLTLYNKKNSNIYNISKEAGGIRIIPEKNGCQVSKNKHDIVKYGT
jgi:hypothetical protein